jgi:uncharacterized protein YjbJ (UPF0337 family)
MVNSRRRDKAEGAIDKVAGRVLEAFSKLTGKRVRRRQGKAARGRGAARSTEGRAKRGR